MSLQHSLTRVSEGVDRPTSPPPTLSSEPAAEGGKEGTELIRSLLRRDEKTVRGERDEEKRRKRMKRRNRRKKMRRRRNIRNIRKQGAHKAVQEPLEMGGRRGAALLSSVNDFPYGTGFYIYIYMSSADGVDIRMTPEQSE